MDRAKLLAREQGSVETRKFLVSILSDPSLYKLNPFPEINSSFFTETIQYLYDLEVIDEEVLAIVRKYAPLVGTSPILFAKVYAGKGYFDDAIHVIDEELR